MTTPPTAMTTPEALQIKLSTQQRRDFTACAQMCGLELAAWIVQCADVKAADAIDAMQALQRVQRPDRKKQRPRLQVEHKEDVNYTAVSSVAEGSAAKSPVKSSIQRPANKEPATKNLVKSSAQNLVTGNTPATSATMKAART